MTDQANQTTEIIDAMKVLTSTSQQINNATMSLTEVTKNIQPTLQSVTAATNTHIKFLANSAKVLQEVSTHLTASQPSPPPGTKPTYMSMATNNSQTGNPISNANYTLQQPRHAQQITNHLLITAKQAYVSYETNNPKAPKDRGGPAAFQLHMKLNNHMKELDTITNQVNEMSSSAIQALQFTEHSAILMEFKSAKSTKHFKTHRTENSLLTSQICPTARLQPHSYWVILKSVPCTGEFDPTDKTQLHEIEEDLSLPKDSIVTAAWIKKPENCSLKQTMANVKVTCTTVEATNKFLTERIFIANLWVVVTKDLQELIHCNKCQEYSHIHENCNNLERCATCTQEHATMSCKNQAEPHCISCSTSSTHTSSDRNKCLCPMR